VLKEGKGGKNEEKEAQAPLGSSSSDLRKERKAWEGLYGY